MTARTGHYLSLKRKEIHVEKKKKEKKKKSGQIK
jgi:hypothetical protein